jgi:hypothetical protein
VILYSGESSPYLDRREQGKKERKYVNEDGKREN